MWRNAPMRVLSSQGDLVDSYDPALKEHRTVCFLAFDGHCYMYRAVKRVLERQAARVLYRGEARQTLPPIQEWRRFDAADVQPGLFWCEDLREAEPRGRGDAAARAGAHGRRVARGRGAHGQAQRERDDRPVGAQHGGGLQRAQQQQRAGRRGRGLLSGLRLRVWDFVYARRLLSNGTYRPIHDAALGFEHCLVAKARRILDAPPRYLAQVKTDCLLTRLPKRFAERLRALTRTARRSTVVRNIGL